MITVLKATKTKKPTTTTTPNKTKQTIQKPTTSPKH